VAHPCPMSPEPTQATFLIFSFICTTPQPGRTGTKLNIENCDLFEI
jgi:hypothetical protein